MHSPHYSSTCQCRNCRTVRADEKRAREKQAELSISEANYLYLEHGVETVRDPDRMAVHGTELRSEDELA